MGGRIFISYSRKDLSKLSLERIISLTDDNQNKRRS